MCILHPHSASKEGRLLNKRLSWPRFLAGDLVEGEEEMVFLCDLGREFDLDFLIELRLPVGGGREGGREEKWNE